MSHTLKPTAGYVHPEAPVAATRLRCATPALNTLKAAEKKYRAGQAAHSAADAPVEDL